MCEVSQRSQPHLDVVDFLLCPNLVGHGPLLALHAGGANPRGAAAVLRRAHAERVLSRRRPEVDLGVTKSVTRGEKKQTNFHLSR